MPEPYLFNGDNRTNIVANRMPLGQGPLSQDQIDLIREWVLNGALDD